MVDVLVNGFGIIFLIFIFVGICRVAELVKDSASHKKTGSRTSRGRGYRDRRFLKKSTEKSERSKPARIHKLLPGLSKLGEDWQPVYTVTHIPKRSGGTRELHVPDQTTKAIQSALYHKLFVNYKNHPAACGFIRGKSIVDNAMPHVGKEVIVKLDICDFFPSTSQYRVRKYFASTGWDDSAAGLLTRLVTYQGGLPQGAPTSPVVSNIINKTMDRKLAYVAETLKADYTRYADDITFSLTSYDRRDIHRLLQWTGAVLRTYGYKLNNKKKRIIRKHRRQQVTGLVVNDKVSVSRQTRRWLRAIQDRLAKGDAITISKSQYQGWISLVHMVSPGSPIIAKHRMLVESGVLNPEPKAVETSKKKLPENTEKINSEPTTSATMQRTRSEAVDPIEPHLSTSDVVETELSGNAAVDTTPNIDNSKVDSEEELFHTDRLVDYLQALKMAKSYSAEAKKLESEIQGTTHTAIVKLESSKRTFSFRLPEGFQKGRTVSGALPDGTEIELYFRDTLAEDIEAADLPLEGEVVIEVVQWNGTFKRLEVIVTGGLFHND